MYFNINTNNIEYVCDWRLYVFHGALSESEKRKLPKRKIKCKGREEQKIERKREREKKSHRVRETPVHIKR